MAEGADKESKTEEATEKKIRDSIDKGQLPFSKEAPVFASFLAILTFTIFFAQDSAVRLGSFLSIFLERADGWSLETRSDAMAIYQLVFMEIAKVVGIVMLLLVTAGVAASVLQNTPRFVLDRIKPKLSRISLKEGWSRIFGAKGFVEFAKSVGKIIVAGGFLVLAMREAETRLLAGMITNPVEFTSVIRDIAVQSLVVVTLVVAVIAVADLFWSRHQWRVDLRMTRQEVKDEHKQTEGDPIVKARLRSLARDRARQRMMSAVPQATLVIANPTHFAIALRYRRDEDAAPVVVAKGQDLIALRIREIATEHNIPVFEEPVLARSMYKQVSVDNLIPSQFYKAVAELIRRIYRTGERP
ncbi:flagellar biosynthesis protein FlhB [Nitratireductor rhodophyticola]|uniref:Flagellar biosynthetic protein FlhB n=2 Tax=Nitratireductor TaxID=245876 RepID=A0A1H4JG48_9HYPH|nr:MULTISPECIES: flagellar biosynthesis protein FlhB [Nitratireductor]MBY8917648.1 flagellar biosynthesis protein FlhB [Nitratireductor rhodophyticola]MEC9245778.1 flagellar biosynthesis protein FlhB [Pseudomonadota bacterium]MBY8922359.1 flagellar biosynthesis protein FlhB [Nitratireductor rhodophyticola]WPZ12694.1 flagellar biosynthesis protein FlhB [Nitratireductor rhodophyticola]SEB45243.1 flagellar biosynthetic protein FlhB [Nitratireductor aquibiodomus]